MDVSRLAAALAVLVGLATSTQAKPKDLFDHLGIATVPGSAKLQPCRSNVVDLTLKLDGVMHTCVVLAEGTSPEDRPLLEIKLQDGYGRELHRTGWQGCGGLANALYFFNPSQTGRGVIMLGLDEAWSSDFGGPPSDPKMILVFASIPRTDIPFRTCPPFGG